ncbi:MAG: CopD family protein [Myxococcota bacterium]
MIDPGQVRAVGRKTVSYLTLKALHLIGAFSWFAGLFYMPRLLIYDVEAQERPGPERDVLQPQLRLMGRRLWNGIATPAMIFTLVFGLWLALTSSHWGSLWLNVKLGFLVLLVAYHHQMGRLRKQILAGTIRWSSTHLRLWNELATIFLLSIVFLAVLKNGAFHWSVPVGIIGTLGALTAGVMAYKRFRLRTTNASPSMSAGALPSEPNTR